MIASYYQDSLVVQLRQVCKRCMALYYQVAIKSDLQLFTEVCHSFGLMFAAAIGEEYERYSLGLEIGKSLVSLRDGI